jgi:hypothetical protein
VIGIYVRLRCWDCADEVESYQPTVGGLAIGVYRCPTCEATYEIWPEDIDTALDRYLPGRALEDLAELTSEATRIAQRWYRAEPLPTLLRYRDVDLGPATERELLSLITLGLVMTRDRGEDPR